MSINRVANAVAAEPAATPTLVRANPLYIYHGDRYSDESLKKGHCMAIRQPDGRCIRGKNGSMLVVFLPTGRRANLIGRLLRKMKHKQGAEPPATQPSRPRCYVAGKVSDLTFEQYTAFFAAGARQVEAMGLLPVVPIDLDHDQHDQSWLACMRLCLSVMMSCDCVYALSNWQASRGATIEVNLAHSLGIPVLEQSEINPPV